MEAIEAGLSEMRAEQHRLTQGIATLNEAVAKLSATMELMLDTQRRHADHDSRIAVLERGQIVIEGSMANLGSDIAAERKGRKADIQWVVGGLLGLTCALLAYMLPHLRWH